MAKTKYQCEKCSGVYDHESQALQCEVDHTAREKSASIRRFGWKHEPTKPGEFPDSVVVTFSENHGDFATYRLGRIGFRPM